MLEIEPKGFKYIVSVRAGCEVTLPRLSSSIPAFAQALPVSAPSNPLHWLYALS